MSTVNMDKYFMMDPKSNCTYFKGKKLEIYIPKRYEAHSLLRQTDIISTLGIFRMVIDDTIECGLFLPAMIDIDPIETYTVTIDEDQYLVAVLHTDNKILISNDIIQNDKLGYILWVEFIALGRLPNFINYQNIPWLFDRVAQTTGISFGINHVVFEMVYAHIFRDPDDITVKYRHTDMKKDPVIIELRNVAYGPDDTLGRILGSYSAQGLNAALINKSDQASSIELQLRA